MSAYLQFVESVASVAKPKPYQWTLKNPDDKNDSFSVKLKAAPSNPSDEAIAEAAEKNGIDTGRSIKGANGSEKRPNQTFSGKAAAQKAVDARRVVLGSYVYSEPAESEAAATESAAS